MLDFGAHELHMATRLTPRGMMADLSRIHLGQRKPHKYRAVRTVYNGQSYPSKLEAKTASELDFMVIGKLIKGWDRGKRMIIAESSDGKKVVHFQPDFVVHNLDGTSYVLDSKGLLSALFRLKALLFKNRYPHLPLKTVDKHGKVTEW